MEYVNFRFVWGRGTCTLPKPRPYPLDKEYYRYGTFVNQSLAPILNGIQDNLIDSGYFASIESRLFIRF